MASSSHFALIVVFAAFCLLPRILAHGTEARRTQHGLIGYGIDMYQPPCAYACRDLISKSPLNCSEHEHGQTEGSMHGGPKTSLGCFATDDAFLETVAWCISGNCKDVPDWRLETYWAKEVVGTAPVQPDPKQTYQESLAKIKEPPSEKLVVGEPLNKTSSVSFAEWDTAYRTLGAFARTEVNHEKYSLVIVLTGLLGPLGLSLLRFAPVPKYVIGKVHAYLIYPATWGKRHSTPLPYNIGIAPTRGQALFIAYFIIINVVLSSVGIHFATPSLWWPDDANAGIRSFVADRLGVLSFANLALAILYAGRNNILLWLTDWSHSTFLLLHRWVAYIATIQAILHSVLWLEIYVNVHKSHSTESKLPYWIWGAVATIAVSIILPLSILPVRQKLYEVFLAWHVTLVVLTLVGCYLHIWYLFQHQWGYEVWVYAAIGAWGFDRLVRLLRLARNGVKRAVVTPLDNDYLRVDIKNIAANGHAYLYFPTLTWRFWENHPFSVASTVRLTAGAVRHGNVSFAVPQHAIDESPPSQLDDAKDLEANDYIDSRITKPVLCLTFFIRNQGGLTSILRSRGSLPVLVESPYGKDPDLTDYPALICIAGGVGITAVLPHLRDHVGYSRLYWGMRNDTLLKALEPDLVGVNKEVSIGKRFNLRNVLEKELGADETDTVVVVSGPAGMADDVREAVSKIGQKSRRARVELIEESFSW